MLIYIYIYIYIYELSYIDRVYINVIISNMRLTSLSLVDMYATGLLGLWSLKTQIHLMRSLKPCQDICQEWLSNKANHVCKAPRGLGGACRLILIRCSHKNPGRKSVRSYCQKN